jgi:hypothetical protein
MSLTKGDHYWAEVQDNNNVLTKHAVKVEQHYCSCLEWQHTDKLCCRYPADRVPPHTGMRLRHRVGRATMCCHVSHSSEPCLLPCAVMCPTALDPASLPRRAPVPPRVQQIWTHFLAEEGSGAATCPIALDPPPC